MNVKEFDDFFRHQLAIFPDSVFPSKMLNSVIPSVFRPRPFRSVLMNSCWIPHAGSENHSETRKSLKICYFFNINREQVYHTRISDVDELKRCITSEWAALSHTVIECDNVEWHQCLRACIHAGVDILWRWRDVTCYFLRDNNCQSYYCLLPFSKSLKYTINYCIYGSIWHFKFPKVVQAHTLGEVGNLGTVLLRAYSGIVLVIFIEIGLHLTDKEQNISWHSLFWDTA